MQLERDSKRKQTQARKEAEAEARLVVLKVRRSSLSANEENISRFQEERERALKAKQEEEMIEKHVIEIRKEMNEKRQQDEEQRKQYVHNFHHSMDVRFSRSTREYDNAKSERTKAEHERARKEEELHKLKEIALKEQSNLSEKRLQTLVDDFIRMKALTVRQPD